MNFAQYVAIPKKLLTPLVVVGGRALLIASTLVGSGAMPLLEKTNPKKVMLDLLNSHLLLLNVSLASANFLNTTSRALS